MKAPDISTLVVNLVAVVGILMVVIDVARVANEALGLAAAGIVFVAAAFVIAGVLDTLN